MIWPASLGTEFDSALSHIYCFTAYLGFESRAVDSVRCAVLGATKAVFEPLPLSLVLPTALPARSCRPCARKALHATGLNISSRTTTKKRDMPFQSPCEAEIDVGQRRRFGPFPSRERESRDILAHTLTKHTKSCNPFFTEERPRGHCTNTNKELSTRTGTELHTR